jgi:hypothetical protein
VLTQGRLRLFALLVCTAALAGCRTHDATASGSTASPTASTSAAASASPTVERTFAAPGGSFTYPATWTLSQFHDAPGSFYVPLAILSNEPVHDPCVTTATSETCGTPISQLTTGGVLIEWGQDLGIGQVFEQPSGSPAAINGYAATIATNPSARPQCAISGTVYEVDAYFQQSTWAMTACLAAPASAATIAAVTAMLQSVHFDQTASSTSPTSS